MTFTVTRKDHVISPGQLDAALCKLMGGHLIYAPVRQPKRMFNFGLTPSHGWPDIAKKCFRSVNEPFGPLLPIQPAGKLPLYEYLHICCINDHDRKGWPHNISQAYSCLEPGAWAEIHDIDFRRYCDDNSIPPLSPIEDWLNEHESTMQELGYNGRLRPQQIVHQMHATGFVQIHSQVLKLPIGTWENTLTLKQAGKLCKEYLTNHLLVSYFEHLVHDEKHDREQLETFLEICQMDLERDEVHTYFPVYIIYGQKPLDCP